MAHSTVPFPHLCSFPPCRSCQEGQRLSLCPSAPSRHCGLASSMAPHRRDGGPASKRKSSILCTPAFLLACHDDREHSTVEPAGRWVTQKQPDTPQAGPSQISRTPAKPQTREPARSRRDNLPGGARPETPACRQGAITHSYTIPVSEF